MSIISSESLDSDIVIKVLKRDGSFESFDIEKIKTCLTRCALGLDIDTEELLNKIITECYHGISTDKINEAIVLESRTKVKYNPDYSYFSARVLLDNIYKQVFQKSVDRHSFIEDYRSGFINYISSQSRALDLGGKSKDTSVSSYSSMTNMKGKDTSILYPELGTRFDLETLAQELIIDNDYLYNIVGIQNLSDRYLLKINGELLETPQYYHMRVAMGLTYNEPDPTTAAIELYKVYSSRRASGSSPVLFNAGTRHNLISCFLSEPDDSIDGIFDNLWQNARKSKHAGGLGFHITKLRAMNSYIKGTRGKSSGIVPWCKLYNDLLLASNQCLHSNTLVITNSGLRSISNITVNDKVLVYDNTFAEISAVHQHKNSKPMLTISFDSGSITCTEDHKFFVLYSKYTSVKIPKDYLSSYGYWIAAKALVVGNDCLYVSSVAGDCCSTTILHIEPALDCTETWDLTVPEYNSFATADCYVHNSGLRNGSGCVYLEPWHLDIESFIELRKSTGDDRRRTHDLNTAIWCNDLLLERYEADQEWTLFDPVDVPLLPESFGEAFKLNYLQYEADTKLGRITNFRVIKAKDLIRKWVENLFGSSSPWMTFKDISNTRYSNQHEGILRGSNLCCVTGDQLVPTQYGLLSVKTLAENYSERDLIIPGLYENVMTTPMVKTLLNQKIWKITTSSGFIHKVTGDHPLWTMNEEWVNAENLTKGTYVRVSNHCSRTHILPIFSKGFSPVEVLSKLKAVHKIDFTSANTGSVCLYTEEEATTLKVQLHYCGISCKVISFKDRWIVENFSLLGLQWDSIIDICVLDTLEDVYCVKVLSSEHKGWTCNGLITKNTEILLHSKHSEYDPEFGNKTKIGETAVCCLHPVNLDAHMYFNTENKKWQMDWDLLKSTITICVRALDNILSLNKYLTEETKNSAMKHRPIGLGTMGWADIFYKLNIIQDSEEAVSISNEITEKFTYYAIEASANLSTSRGSYKTFSGSLWCQGVLPIDTWKSWYNDSKNKALLSIIDFPETMDWKSLREKVKLGMRNSNVVAIAPTASTAYLTGIEQSIEPSPSVLWTYENLSGMMTVINEHFVRDMKDLGLWSTELVDRITQVDSDISQLPEIPEFYKRKYCLAFNRDMTWLVYSNAARQKWVDQGISFNLYANTTSKKAIADLYILCWKMGLKTTYYLRIPKASTVTKTINTLVNSLRENKLSEQEICSIQNKEACEMCQ